MHPEDATEYLFKPPLMEQSWVQGLVPAVTSELFGLENFATNYAIIMLGPAAGAAGPGAALCCVQCADHCLGACCLVSMTVYGRRCHSQAWSPNRPACSVYGPARLQLHATCPIAPQTSVNGERTAHVGHRYHLANLVP